MKKKTLRRFLEAIQYEIEILTVILVERLLELNKNNSAFVRQPNYRLVL